jgi:o-succinylbenzoate---CoA ligase
MEYDRESIYALFCRRLQTGWLVGANGAATIDRADRAFVNFTQSQPHFISIATHDSIEFIVTFMAGLRLGIPIFLCNPHWGKVEWAQVAKLTAQIDPQQHQNTIMIPTGGSSGEVKFAIHTWTTLSESVWGFQEFYGVAKINTVCTLPLYHVSGLMQLVRSILTDGKLLITDFHQLCKTPDLITSQIEIDRYFISLVPTQLSKLLDLDSSWLTKFHAILLGGAPPSIELLNSARIIRLPLALTYGMTETASQITSLKPAEFLAGNNSCGRVLPHASIDLTPSANMDEKLIRITAKSLMLGYFPTLGSLTKSSDLNLHTKDSTVNCQLSTINCLIYFEPDDLGSFDLDGYLTIVGRNSGKIITGGENVFPIEVINAIMATGLVADVWVMGLADRYWGQVVVAIYVENSIPVSDPILSNAISGNISKYKIPKYWIPVPQIPRNALGKVLIHELEPLLKSMEN